MFRTARGFLILLGVGTWTLASGCDNPDDTASTVSVGGQSSSQGGVEATGTGGELVGQGGDAASGGENLGLGGDAGSGGDVSLGGSGGELGGASGAGGAAGESSLAVAAAAVVADYAAKLPDPYRQYCEATAPLSCAPPDCIGDIQRTIDDWATAIGVREPTVDSWDARTGCIREAWALFACWATVPSDQWECYPAGSAYAYPLPKGDHCVAEDAANVACQEREIRNMDLATSIWELEAGLDCALDWQAFCKARDIEVYRYSALGCGLLDERWLTCLANQTQYDFECRAVGANTVPARKQYVCQSEYTDLAVCAGFWP